MENRREIPSGVLRELKPKDLDNYHHDTLLKNADILTTIILFLWFNVEFFEKFNEKFFDSKILCDLSEKIRDGLRDEENFKLFLSALADLKANKFVKITMLLHDSINLVRTLNNYFYGNFEQGSVKKIKDALDSWFGIYSTGMIQERLNRMRNANSVSKNIKDILDNLSFYRDFNTTKCMLFIWENIEFFYTLFTYLHERNKWPNNAEYVKILQAFDNSFDNPAAKIHQHQNFLVSLNELMRDKNGSMKIMAFVQRYELLLENFGSVIFKNIKDIEQWINVWYVENPEALQFRKRRELNSQPQDQIEISEADFIIHEDLELKARVIESAENAEEEMEIDPIDENKIEVIKEVKVSTAPSFATVGHFSKPTSKKPLNDENTLYSKREIKRL